MNLKQGTRCKFCETPSGLGRAESLSVAEAFGLIHSMPHCVASSMSLHLTVKTDGAMYCLDLGYLSKDTLICRAS